MPLLFGTQSFAFFPVSPCSVVAAPYRIMVDAGHLKTVYCLLLFLFLAVRFGRLYLEKKRMKNHVIATNH